MTDLDFDELDKAVNSLMGKVGDQTLEDTKAVTKTLTVNTTLEKGEEPKYDALGKVAEKIGDTAIETVKELTLVENWSAEPIKDSDPHITELDTLKQDLADPSKHPVLAVGTKPHVDIVNKADATAAAEKPSEMPSRPPATRRPSGGRFLDMVHPSANMRPATAAAPRSAAVVVGHHGRAMSETMSPASAPLHTHSTTGPVPGPSPFIQDAKVEKRPLGGESPADDAAEAEPSKAAETEKLVLEPKMDDRVDVIETVSVEGKQVDDGTGDDQRPIDATGFDAEVDKQERQLASIESEVAEEPSYALISEIESADTEHLSNGGAEKADDAGGEASGAIYDTKEYHKPLDHPAKKKSGWGVIVTIVLIIVIAAALAGAAYFVIVKP